MGDRVGPKRGQFALRTDCVPWCAHHIDNLEGACLSDTVNIEVNYDSYRCLPHRSAG
jgi:hypothetical protein